MTTIQRKAKLSLIAMYLNPWDTKLVIDRPKSLSITCLSNRELNTLLSA